MVRVLRYPRLSAASCALAISCALARDLCSGAGLDGLSRVLLFATGLLLALCFLLLSCRFFVDGEGVGVGFLLRVRRTPWNDLAALGALCCNSRRVYLYGLYRGRADFLQMLHRAPVCGEWGFVAPLNRRLAAAVQTYCPYGVDLTPPPCRQPKGRLRPLWHQAALYPALMLPTALIAFLTAALMLLRAAGQEPLSFAFGLTAAAFGLCLAGAMLVNRAGVALMTCPRISEEGVGAGRGLILRRGRLILRLRRALRRGRFGLFRARERIGRVLARLVLRGELIGRERVHKHGRFHACLAALFFLLLGFFGGQPVLESLERPEGLLRLLARPGYAFQQPARAGGNFLGSVLYLDFGHLNYAPPRIAIGKNRKNCH